ncbi:hypothetical protein K439DRAFT_1625553, partial [Ramaria rubella]
MSEATWQGLKQKLQRMETALQTRDVQLLEAKILIADLASRLQCSEANEGAANTHATLWTLEVKDICEQFSELKHKTRHHHVNTGSGEAEHITKEAQEAAKHAEKDTAEHARELQCAQNAVLKVFDAPLASYKCKYDLKDITATFILDQSGTIAKLLACCQHHLVQNPLLEQNP